MGINRYIMECKFHNPINKTSSCLELIDTLWNVNYSAANCLAVVPGINRYIMECKYKKRQPP